MITLTHISPGLSLASFVQFYQLLEFDTDGQELAKPWHGSVDQHIVFFLKDKPLYLRDEKRGYLVEGTHNIAVLGLATHFNGLMKFKGQYKCFLILFAPTGLARLFGLPLHEITNKIYAADELFGNPAKELLDQLQNASTLEDMASSADRFLTNILNKKKSIHLLDGITKISNELSTIKGILHSVDYADRANMSLRNFERKFHEQVGISAKMYARLLRFNETIKLKTQQPERNWISIAYECGYYDYQHLVKEFKEFTDASPTHFFSQMPPPEVHSIFVRRV
uniref:Helix-turn-helix domain-containing protein n=1 Tax=Roseihalotalea indica TaxID=2867963 RepID=A0AA49JJF4_9BACT|nr:helix-turn-helix domain-containing protein [Tunicatimonas sp. TK19036]